ncbi:hypothetical protein JQV19_10950 [Sulfitobacter mediterraneus]|uniref:Uncharacterized protein n=2 Tax=Sulfitobacter mediterraneus TaxID=83219 RepID=A0A061SXV9_9RHOB|nr:hypothetical protein [Sulfitobacter mediterraneus]KAJ05039.1 hypothetical protein PM02_00690 [Sulfitobacter mediterraneus]MBM1557157.1 hypothetical protein [Sulfitobacter mediterraneus]MBM1572194.1 hypothetical protein [Sulfitobacter mediterraneus]MBM1580305.1 hypothetical protein [Sulfitobacter mediterraneus]MBM1583910.1 hypothetical protein [Sulfitobacter mediterraneus]
MRLYNWVNLGLVAGLCMSATPGLANCLPKSLAKLVRPQTVQAVCRGEALIPFDIKTRYIGEGGYHAFAAKPRKAGRSKTFNEVGIVTLAGTPIPSVAQAKKMMGHFERRRKCPASDLRYSSTSATLFRVTCSQGDKR